MKVDAGNLAATRLRSLADRLVMLEAERRSLGDCTYAALMPEAADALRELAAIKHREWESTATKVEPYCPPKRWTGD